MSEANKKLIDCINRCGRKTFHVTCGHCNAESKRKAKNKRKPCKKGCGKKTLNEICFKCEGVKGVKAKRSLSRSPCKNGCGRKINGDYCHKWQKKLRVECTCISCGDTTETSMHNLRFCIEKQGGIKCKNCIRLESSERFKNYQASLTKEQRVESAKTSNSLIKNPAANVRKQWETIKNDPERMEILRKQRGETTRERWENYAPEEKNRHLQNCLGVRSRSKGSEELKQRMIDEGLFQGFESEQPFCGFIPDEINHDLKLIIEYYGDKYHCNPKEFKDPNQYQSYTKRTVGEQWKRDRRRVGAFYKAGYSVLIIWESDFREDPDIQIERVRNFIQEGTYKSA